MENKKTAVFGIFKSVAAADAATNAFVKAGFATSDISALLPENLGTKQIGTEKATKAPEGATAGASAGAVLGGTLGLLAGSSLIATVEEANGDQIQDLFDANLFGMVRALIAALPLLRKQGSGHILGVSSSLGIVPMPLIGFYGGVDFGLSIFNNLRTINHEAWFDSHPRLPKAVSGAVFGTRNQSWSVSMHSEEADQ
jgi:NAD(P)-dependent dehydrogenase (short-subunit alcohol dehydrogenase family)